MAETVYILSNPAMPGLLKIGMTDKKNLQARMNELYTTGVPLPFDCVCACIVANNAEVEKALHQKFAKKRVNPRREFFSVSAKSAVKALKPYVVTDITLDFRLDFDSGLLEEEKVARRKERRVLEKSDPTIKESKYLHMEIVNPEPAPPTK